MHFVPGAIFSIIWQNVPGENLILSGVQIVNNFDEFVSLIETEVAKKKVVDVTETTQVTESMEAELPELEEMIPMPQIEGKADIILFGTIN